MFLWSFVKSKDLIIQIVSKQLNKKISVMLLNEPVSAVKHLDRRLEASLFSSVLIDELGDIDTES